MSRLSTTTSFIGSRRDDACRATAAREDRDLAEHVARSEGSNDATVVTNLGRSLLDRVGREAEVALANERRSRVDLDLLARPCDRLPLVDRQVGEERDRGELRRVHGATLATCCDRSVNER